MYTNKLDIIFCAAFSTSTPLQREGIKLYRGMVLMSLKTQPDAFSPQEAYAINILSLQLSHFRFKPHQNQQLICLA